VRADLIRYSTKVGISRMLIRHYQTLVLDIERCRVVGRVGQSRSSWQRPAGNPASVMGHPFRLTVDEVKVAPLGPGRRADRHKQVVQERRAPVC